MAKTTSHLIYEYVKKGNSLGRSLLQDGIPKLIQDLRVRLGLSEEELDLSPASLGTLESRIADLKRAAEEGSLKMDDDEVIRLMRELAAYLGQVLVANLDGEWLPSPHFGASPVTVPLPVTSIKGDDKVVSSSIRGIDVGHTAAEFWDIIGTGQKTGFLRAKYEYMTEPVWHEEL
jgi:hypothetical protein